MIKEKPRTVIDFFLILLIISYFFLFRMAAVARIDALIKQFPVFVVSKTYCPFCTMAKDVLKRYNIPQDKMKILEIENDPDCGEIQDHMLKITGGRTVPRVFIQGECIGGGSEASAADSSGDLEKKLKAAGAI